MTAQLAEVPARVFSTAESSFSSPSRRRAGASSCARAALPAPRSRNAQTLAPRHSLEASQRLTDCGVPPPAGEEARAGRLQSGAQGAPARPLPLAAADGSRLAALRVGTGGARRSSGPNGSAAADGREGRAAAGERRAPRAREPRLAVCLEPRAAGGTGGLRRPSAGTGPSLPSRGGAGRREAASAPSHWRG